MEMGNQNNEKEWARRIAIVDDHTMFREGLRFLLSEIPNVEVVSESKSGKEFIDSLTDDLPDLVLMDISMPEMNGIEATRLAKEMHPELNIVALTMFGEEDYYYQMIHAGAKGFLLKESGSRELEEAITTVLNGDNYFSMSLLKTLIVSLNEKRNEPVIELTNRENEILQLICTGLSAKEIANELKISPRTVESHKAKLFEKTDTQNTSALIMTAIKKNLVAI